MRRLPPLNALKAFEATARLSSVTAAADELNVSHSAVSQHIKQIEDYFGQKLFTRPGRRVEPNAAALRYLEDVKAAFDRLAIASEQLARRGDTHIVTVSATPSVAMRWFIPKTAAFQHAHPNIELRVTTSTSDEISHLDKPFDIVIRRDEMTRPGHFCRKLLDDISTPVASPAYLEKHPVAKPADLFERSLLHLRSRPHAWQAWFAQRGEDLPDTIAGPYFDHFFLSLQAAINGLGVAMAPHALAADDLESGHLVAPFPDLTIEGAGFHILCRNDIVAERAPRTFLRWLEKETGASLIPAKGEDG